MSNYKEYVELANNPRAKKLADSLEKISQEIKENRLVEDRWAEFESRYNKPIHSNSFSD